MKSKEVVWFEEWETPWTRAKLVRRFLEKTRPVPGSSCIEWTGAKNNKGYGVFRSPLNTVRGRTSYGTSMAHRVAYWIVRGPVPKSKQIDHECRNVWCVNPYHLRLLDPYNNTALGNIDRHNNSIYDKMDDVNWEEIL